MMKTILPLATLVVLLGCNTTVNQDQNSLKYEQNSTSAMLSISYNSCLDKGASPGNLFENCIKTLKRTAQESNLKDFTIDNKELTISTNDSCHSTSIQLFASFVYDSKQVNTLYQKLHDKAADDWKLSLVIY
ncbi:hypothetical protein ABWH96_05205 [Marivirga tractuosa]|uniref:hypothetical protein n=1 Tax=Marivirga tractuosa TaxID=1006 RepID=UPI0035D0C430